MRLRHAFLHKSVVQSAQSYPVDPHIPLQITTNFVDSRKISHPDITSDHSPSNPSDKRSKRSRFDLKESFQRSKSMCITQIHSWLQRRRHQSQSQTQSHTSPRQRRRKSAFDSKMSPSNNATPKLFGSPRLARLHQRFFKASPSPVSTDHSMSSSRQTNEFDQQSQIELPVRIYFPPSSLPLEVFTPVTHRKALNTIKVTTAKERRESFATTSNIFHQKL